MQSSMTGRTLSVYEKRWPMREPMALSRGVQTEQQTVIVEIDDGHGRVGRGEGCGVRYAGETPESMMAQIESVRSAVETGAGREDLLALLPPGGARCALDAALWDLEAKTLDRTIYELLGIAAPKPLVTAVTIGIRPPEAYEAAACELRRYPMLKIKVDGTAPIASIAAVRRGAPHARLIVDPNQSWSIELLSRMAPRLAELDVDLLEQPIPAGEESRLDGVDIPVNMCADELVATETDLDKAAGRFGVVNIKLDKAGGLTAAWCLADAALARGFKLMAGCMFGSSLSMAPAHVLGQRCTFVDLDGPLVQAEDWPGGLAYHDGVVMPPERSFWG